MNESDRARRLAGQALEVLRRRLPPYWTVDLVDQPTLGGADFRLTLGTSQGTSAAALLEVKKGFRPADIDALTGGITRRLRAAAGDAPIILVSESLSTRSRELLAKEDIGYIDLDGNVRLSLRYPGIFVETTGDQRKPAVSRRRPGPRSLRGSQAARLVRCLADVRPPYGVVEIAEATGLSRGYVSLLLDFLSEERLIVRESRGRVTEVDWPALLRQRAEAVDLFRTNTAVSFIAPNGAKATLEALGRDESSDAVVTGSFAAYRRAPVAAPTLLAFYTLRDSSVAQRTFGLLPADEGADVVVLRPPNSMAFELAEDDQGLRYAAPTQVAIDCLSGPGRMPSEGEALIEALKTDEATWRRSDLAKYVRDLSLNPHD